MELHHQPAKNLMLAAQGLLCNKPEPETKADVLATIRRMGVLQIDTINVVARSPYLVLWSRLGHYEPRWLDELLAEGNLFEHWSHEACFIPVEDYPLYRRFMLDRWVRSRAWVEANPETISLVLDYVRDNGPVRSADFVRTDGQKTGWWNWKPEKRALEMLYTSGELMIAQRKNFHRLYDLREKVMPGWDDAHTPPLPEVQRDLALKAVKALGIAIAPWLVDYFRLPKLNAAALLEDLANSGLLVKVSVKDWYTPAYIHPDNLALAEAAASGSLRPELTTLLSPFDPLVWDRKRAKYLFGFDYTIECYKPARQRRFGYFSLPILHNGELVGRLDPKAHRKEGIFEIKALHLEPGVAVTEQLVLSLTRAIKECAIWHKTPEVVIRQTYPQELAGLLNAAIA